MNTNVNLNEPKKDIQFFKKDYESFLTAVQSFVNCNFSGFKTTKSNSNSISIELYQPLTILAEEVALNHGRPKGIRNIEILINFRITYNNYKYIDLFNNTTSSNLSIIVKSVGNSGSNYKGFHFDLDNPKSEQHQLHPKYHCQFLVNPQNIETFDYGNVLQLDIPRFTHFPMELILGTSFILANFLPETFSMLKEDRDFVKLQRKYQKHYWEPYIKSLQSLLSSDLNSNQFKAGQELQPYWI
ncbi:hypothetical protein [Psychrobacter sp. I-STPA6b]|uniref:hypothetical protein n=1 Tax=Psychrobacter sp. I-STPA6b TaxID=2585718 RepID=UPI001D0C15DF|nr:hypothetical protein [Psychrobacter sp. I-STPA6b]